METVGDDPTRCLRSAGREDGHRGETMSEEIALLLRESIAAARAGDKERARRLLLEVTERDERNEEAWLWLSGVVDDPEEMRICLENVLAINPANERARQGLAWVQKRLAQRPSAPLPPPPPPPIPPPPPVEEPAVAPAVPRPAPAEERPAANRVPCPACGALNFDFATECVRCGFPFAVICPSCNELVSTETGLCPRCGKELPLPRKMPAVREREAQVEESYRQGLAWMEKKRYQEAKVAFEEALTLDPNHVEARYNLGLACARLGLRDEARRHWEEVRERQPDYPDIQKDLDSLLPLRERRRLLKERKKAEAPARGRREPARPAGQTLLAEFERKMEEKPVPEEETGGVEALIYVLLVGLVFGVALALGRLPSGALTSGLPSERIVAIAKQSGVVAVIVVLFGILSGLLARLLSRIFKARGKMGGYMVCAARLLMPFFLLILPIVLSIPLLVNSLPETVRPYLQRPVSLPPLGQLPSLPWLACGGLALFWGLFAFVRGIGRVGQMALWKGFLLGMVALLLAVALTGALVYGGYSRLQGTTYLDMLGFAPWEETPTPSPTPPLTPSPATAVPTPPSTSPTPPSTP